MTTNETLLKQCTKCGALKPKDDFYKAKDMKDGRQSLCKECKRAHSRLWWHTNIEKNRENVRKWHRSNTESVKKNVRKWKQNNPDKMREQHLKRKYGIGDADFQVLLSNQSGVCAICGTAELGKRGRLHIDHDHITGVIRGLLCGNCNRGIGLFKDTPNLLVTAANYLKNYQTVTGGYCV